MCDFRSTEYASESSVGFREMNTWEISKAEVVHERRCLDLDPGAHLPDSRIERA